MLPIKIEPRTELMSVDKDTFFSLITFLIHLTSEHVTEVY